MRHFDHLAFAFVHPPLLSPATFIHQAVDLGCGPNRVSLLTSSRGTRLAVFSSCVDRENAVNNGPFFGREASVHFERHDETDNRFLFAHDAMAALSIADFPMEHWNKEHITESTVPFANPHNIDPICLTGMDYSVVLVTVKAESLADIPFHLTVKNHCSIGAISRVSIIEFEDISANFDGPPSDPDYDSVPDALSDEDFVEIEGGTGFATILNALGVPPPAIPHGAPSSAAPVASLVSRALSAAPPLPLAYGDALHSKPKKVIAKLRLGFFDILVLGSLGEKAFYRLPLRHLAPNASCKGLMVVNLATSSVGLIDSIATIGPMKRIVLSVDILAKGSPPAADVVVPLDFTTDLVMGVASSSSALIPHPASSLLAIDEVGDQLDLVDARSAISWTLLMLVPLLLW
jgi:hypothetical protein